MRRARAEAQEIKPVHLDDALFCPAGLACSPFTLNIWSEVKVELEWRMVTMASGASSVAASSTSGL